MFQTIWFITRDFLSFQPGSCNIPYKKPTQTQPLMINPTVWNMSGTVYRNYNKHSRWISQQCLSIQQYNSMSWLIQKFHIFIWVPFLLSVLAITHCDPT